MAANNATNENELLAFSIQGKLHPQSPLRAHHSIFRIPNVLLNGNEKIYVPNLLSIGPFHRGLSLETMERDTTAGNNYPLSLSLPVLTLRYFKESTLGMDPKVNGTFVNKHLLDFIKNSLLGSYAEKNEFEHSSWSPIPSATNLKKAGVIFRCGKKDDMLNIIYEYNVMKIPPIRIHGNGESLFRNIIAYEQCEPIGISKFTSYAVVLENLIKFEDDVELLTERGIIVNNFSGGDIPLLMSNLASDVRVYNFSYTKLYEKVNAYYLTRWRRLHVPFRRIVEDPLAFFNFTCAVVLVTLLTFIQTFISVLTYNDKSV
ncbi:hypothetical protein ACE6H2_010965 [Prunus campanulata]